MTKMQDQFAKAMVHKMTSFALGRPLSFADRAEIETMATKLRSRGDGLKDLVSIIIHSKLFRNKITKENENE